MAMLAIRPGGALLGKSCKGGGWLRMWQGPRTRRATVGGMPESPPSWLLQPTTALWTSSPQLETPTLRPCNTSPPLSKLAPHRTPSGHPPAGLPRPGDPGPATSRAPAIGVVVGALEGLEPGEQPGRGARRPWSGFSPSLPPWGAWWPPAGDSRVTPRPSAGARQLGGRGRQRPGGGAGALGAWPGPRGGERGGAWAVADGG